MKLYFFSLLTLISVDLKSQLVSDSILVDSHYRTFHFNRPIKELHGASLIFILHGSGGNGKGMLMRTAKLESMAMSENLLIVYPDGYHNYWNECRKYATSDANRENINENAFFSGMIAYFNKKYHIDESRIGAAGFSGGGHMAYKLGMTMPGEVKAISAIVANMPDSASIDCLGSGIPLPVLIINGTEDLTNPYNGGEMFVNNSNYGVVRSTEKSVNYWSSLAGYKGHPIKKTLPDTDPSDQKKIESYIYKESGKPGVALLKIIGGKHDYPNDIDVYAYVWEFFKSEFARKKIGMPNVAKKTMVVETACGECQFGLKGNGCDLAVRIDGKSYFVDGTDIDSHGDAHAKDGFCNAIRKADVQGEVLNGRFLVSYFKLLEK
jgi:polyhydroxybutyrate depolymerase